MKELFLGISFLLITALGFSQKEMMKIPEDAAVVKEAIRAIYNFEFDRAREITESLKSEYGNHPGYHMVDAMTIFYEVTQDLDSPVEDTAYEAALSKVVTLSEEWLKKDPDNQEATFFALISHSFYSLYHGENKNYTTAINEARLAYRYLKRGFEYRSTNPEFYLSSGLYYFYVVQYPETHPGVKPFMVLFPGGDVDKGLELMDSAGVAAVFTQPEAVVYLNHVYAKYMSDHKKSLEYANILRERYPDNPYFKCKRAESLLFLERYEEALPLINDVLKSEYEYYQMAAKALKGVYYEKGQKDLEKARALYAEAKIIGMKKPTVTYDYMSFAYVGLARIYESEENHVKAKSYYKRTLEFAEYESIKAEANKYLDSH